MTAQSTTLPKPHSLLAEVARTLLYALAIVMVVRALLWQPFNIPSASMAETLLPGDYVGVSKFAYGYSRYSLPGGLGLFSGRIFGADPQRGDVAVFKLPRDNATDYIKRVIGLPGDRIQMKRGILHINGQPVGMKPLGEAVIAMGDGPALRGKRYLETLPDGRSYTIFDKYEASAGDNTAEYVVPEGHYFMLGDNRDDSTDSRFAPKSSGGAFIENKDGVGFVPSENLVGRADTIFFSADGTAGFLDVWNWPSAIRWDRIFGGVE
ncbi:MAG: signal peptidase I [Alphaproteobacteria bacterium]|nr:signal peptidase I [Alphaproteobacteria bacterium]